MTQIINTIFNRGYLDLILGPMFSGKSTKLIKYIRDHKTLGINVMVIKPDIDNRYTNESSICTHNNEKENCVMLPIDKLDKIFEIKDYENTIVIAIEEGQFFMNLFEIVKKMVDIDKKIIYITAINGDANRNLFGDIYKLISYCDNIEFMQALCVDCKDGTPGIYSKKITKISTTNTNNQTDVGGADKYKAVCRRHYLLEN